MIEAAFGFLVGIILGSFVKATSERLAANEPITGRSYCRSCKQILSWYDLFPVLSYIFLKGRCCYCHKKIPQSLIWTEVIMGVVVGLWFMVYGLSLGALATAFSLFVITVLAIVFLVDLKTGLILDKVSYPATMVALGYAFLKAINQQEWSIFINPALTGVGISLFFVFLIMVTRGRGMGWGDVKFVLFLGLALGFPNAILGIFLAFLLGAVVSVLLIAFSKKKFGQTIPFGPFLSLGAYIALVWGDQILNWYLKVSLK